MRMFEGRAIPKVGFALLALVSTLLLSRSFFIAADTLPRQIADDAFWRMVSGFSEESGSFRFEFMSNERGFQYVIPELTKITKPGGVYLGVGPEQNFTYLAAIQPKIAFIIDIRRQNMLEHLIYKAAFEMSSDRADFISRVFSRRKPPELTDESSVNDMFRAYRLARADPELFGQNLQAIKDRLIKDHHFQLTNDDLMSIDSIYEALFNAGTGFSYSGGFLRNGAITYASLMTATDVEGQARSYLATEENFQFVKEMERKNLIVPLVGDFAGPKALRTVATYVRDHGSTVTVFYTSNVEQYLFQQNDDWRQFLSNVATFPIDSSSTFIRSSRFSYRGQQVRQLIGGNFVQLLCSMSELINGFNAGLIQTYGEVIQMSR